MKEKRKQVDFIAICVCHVMLGDDVCVVAVVVLLCHVMLFSFSVIYTNGYFCIGTLIDLFSCLASLLGFWHSEV